MSPQELIEIRSFLLSGNVDFEQRLDFAKTSISLLEKMNRSSESRSLCLAFYSTIAPLLTQDETVVQLDSQDSALIQLVEQGNRQKAVETYQILISQNPEAEWPPFLCVLALKADDMVTAYKAFLADLANRKLTAYANYLLGILMAREKRFVEAERLLELSRDKLGHSKLEQWLATDLVKVSLVLRNMEKAEALVKKWLEKNPNDPHFINLWMYCLIEQNKKDIARQKLAQVIPLLVADPYLLAETANLALKLNEYNKGAAILEKYEDQIEPNHDFYKTFSLIRKSQGRMAEAQTYAAKADQIEDARVDVSKGTFPGDVSTEQLRRLIQAQWEKRRSEIAGIEVANTLDRVYLYLLSRDSQSAVEELKKLTHQQNNYANAQFLLASIQRRIGKLAEAVQTLEALRKNRPQYRSYEILSLLADFYVRLNDLAQAENLYQQLERQFPQSYQAGIARNYLQTASWNEDHLIYPIHVSTLMSRYSQYDAPFLLSEITNYWERSRVKFANISTLLGVSPRRGLDFDEFVSALVSGTRYQVVPFIGTAAAVREYLEQKIPIVYCQGEMFANQSISKLALLVGMDTARRVFYAESVTPSSQHLFSEAELMEGICFAVYPSSLQIRKSEELQKAVQEGNFFVQLNRSALLSQRQPNYDLTEFNAQKITVQTEHDPMWIPHKLSFIRWEIRNNPLDTAKSYIDSVKSVCGDYSQYWFLAADTEFRKTKSEQSLAILEQAIQKQPDEPVYHLAKVRVLNKIGKTNEAILIAETLREQYPENAFVSAHLVALYKKAGATKLMDDEESRLKGLLHVQSVSLDFEEDPQSSP